MSDAEVATNERMRPQTRAECEYAVRPCPWVGCKFNLFLDVNERGGVKLNHPDAEPLDIDPGQSCALDLAEAGKSTLVSVARMMNLTRERVRQIEDVALARLRLPAERLDLCL